VLTGGETVLESFEVAYTPGHASHHVSYLYEDTAFVGDAGGVRIMPSNLTVPPTPPPDIDVELWHESIQRIVAWQPRRPRPVRPRNARRKDPRQASKPQPAIQA
jgi:glyoxylase-like metal-dependent hydrolase (beta-lactamase superfamily II)